MNGTNFNELLGVSTATSGAKEPEPLTLEKLKESVKLLESMKPPQMLDIPNFNPYTFSGIKIHEVPVRIVPVVQISESFEWLTDEARERLNSQLIDLLGFKEICPLEPGQMIAFRNGFDGIAMRPEMVKALCTLYT